MATISKTTANIYSKLGHRGSFSLIIQEIAEKNNDVVVLTADLGLLTGLTRFKEKFPEKYLNMGIAEQNLIGVAAGLAKEGKVVFATTYSNFLSMRAYEQIRIFLGYMNLNVKIIGTGSGVVMGMSGNTHYGIEDMALMRAIPNIVLLSPADCVETIKAVEASAEYNGPVYIRLTGGQNHPQVYSEDYKFEIGKAVELKKGKDISIIATGTMVSESLKVAEMLEEMGISTSVINMHTIKPIDENIIEIAAKNSKLIVTIEEHSIVGGLGSAVAELISEKKLKREHLLIGLPDSFLKVAEYGYLLEKYGLTKEKILKKIFEFYSEIV